MQFKDAAYQILEKTGHPLHYTEITEKAILAGLIETEGRTPEATMGALLYTDTLREDSRFERVGKGCFGIRGKRQTGLVEQIEAVNEETRRKLRRMLEQIHPQLFEVLVGNLLRAMGLDEDSIDVTQYSRDRGIDVRGTMKAYGLTEVKVAVQVKRWKGNIGRETVQKLRGAINPAQEHGIIITTGDFTNDAKKEARADGVGQITLINGEMLIDLLIRNRVGVGSQQHWVYTIDEEYWADLLKVNDPGSDDAQLPHAGNDSPAGITFPLKIRSRYKGKEFLAELLDQQGKVRFEGTEYATPTAAALVTMPGRRSVNGWTHWQYEDPVTNKWIEIDSIRK